MKNHSAAGINFLVTTSILLSFYFIGSSYYYFFVFIVFYFIFDYYTGFFSEIKLLFVDKTDFFCYRCFNQERFLNQTLTSYVNAYIASKPRDQNIVVIRTKDWYYIISREKIDLPFFEKVPIKLFDDGRSLNLDGLIYDYIALTVWDSPDMEDVFRDREYLEMLCCCDPRGFLEMIRSRYLALKMIPGFLKTKSVIDAIESYDYFLNNFKSKGVAFQFVYFVQRKTNESDSQILSLFPPVGTARVKKQIWRIVKNALFGALDNVRIEDSVKLGHYQGLFPEVDLAIGEYTYCGRKSPFGIVKQGLNSPHFALSGSSGTGKSVRLAMAIRAHFKLGRPVVLIEIGHSQRGLFNSLKIPYSSGADGVKMNPWGFQDIELFRLVKEAIYKFSGITFKDAVEEEEEINKFLEAARNKGQGEGRLVSCYSSALRNNGLNSEYCQDYDDASLCHGYNLEGMSQKLVEYTSVMIIAKFWRVLLDERYSKINKVLLFDECFVLLKFFDIETLSRLLRKYGARLIISSQASKDFNVETISNIETRAVLRDSEYNNEFGFKNPKIINSIKSSVGFMVHLKVRDLEFYGQSVSSFEDILQCETDILNIKRLMKLCHILGVDSVDDIFCEITNFLTSSGSNGKLNRRINHPKVIFDHQFFGIISSAFNIQVSELRKCLVLEED